MATVIGKPMVNAGILYINGLGVSYLSGTTLSVAVGAARNSTNQNDIINDSVLTINAATNGANGLDSGSLANNTTYYVYIIGDSLGHQPVTDIITQVSTMAPGTTIVRGTVVAEGVVAQPPSTINNHPGTAALLSTSATAPVLPVGYDMFRRIGTVLTNGAAAILPFVTQPVGFNQIEITFATPIQVLNAGAAAVFTAVDLTPPIPAMVTNVMLDSIFTPTAAGDTFALRPTGSTSAGGTVIGSGSVAGVAVQSLVTVQSGVALGNASIDYLVDTGALTLNVMGYVDQL